MKMVWSKNYYSSFSLCMQEYRMYQYCQYSCVLSPRSMAVLRGHLSGARLSGERSSRPSLLARALLYYLARPTKTAMPTQASQALINSARKLAHSHAGSARKNRLFWSKFCSDTLILLEFCSYPKKIFSPSGRIYFRQKQKRTWTPGGGYSHTLPIRICAAQRGRDFEAPDLERGIHFRGVFQNGV